MGEKGHKWKQCLDQTVQGPIKVAPIEAGVMGSQVMPRELKCLATQEPQWGNLGRQRREQPGNGSECWICGDIWGRHVRTGEAERRPTPGEGPIEERPNPLEKTLWITRWRGGDPLILPSIIGHGERRGWVNLLVH